tara:strand:+ start:291 stop:485 length:195 start_codon:yes stop_codon:yes gene_type:complete
MRIREKLNNMLKDFEEVNLGSEAARQALIDRIVDIVQREPVEAKYWNINKSGIKDDTGKVIHPD